MARKNYITRLDELIEMTKNSHSIDKIFELTTKHINEIENEYINEKSNENHYVWRSRMQAEIDHLLCEINSLNQKIKKQ